MAVIHWQIMLRNLGSLTIHCTYSIVHYSWPGTPNPRFPNWLPGSQRLTFVIMFERKKIAP